MADTRTYVERVEDSVLVSVHQIHRLRGIPVRGALADFRATAVANLADSLESDSEDVWRVRLDRVDALDAEPDDSVLRRRVGLALERERG